MENKLIQIVEDKAHGKLPVGLEVKGKKLRDFVMRPYDVGDMFDAEAETPAFNTLAFNGQLMVRMLERVGDFEGPFTLNMLRGLKPQDWNMLRQAMTELEKLGEGD